MKVEPQYDYQKRLFTGREWNGEIGIYDYRNRIYSPELGRFLQTDPIRFEAGDVNLYRYVSNNPVKWIDAFGLMSSIAKKIIPVHETGGGNSGPYCVFDSTEQISDSEGNCCYVVCWFRCTHGHYMDMRPVFFWASTVVYGCVGPCAPPQSGTGSIERPDLMPILPPRT
jgi:RHS repeat-associated protein